MEKNLDTINDQQKPKPAGHNGFARIPNRILSTKLKSSTKLVLCLLFQCAYGNKTEVWPSQVWLSKRSGLDRKTVRTALGELVVLKAIEEISRDGRGQARYRLLAKEDQTWGDTPTKPGEFAPTNKTADKADNIDKIEAALDVASDPDDVVEPERPIECYGSAESAKDNGLGKNPQVGSTLSKQIVNRYFLTPDGASVNGNRFDLEYDLQNLVLPMLGTDLITPSELDNLIDRKGVEFCQLWAAWLSRKVAKCYEQGNPVTKPAGLYVKAVREGWEVDPSWPEFDEYNHTWAAKVRRDYSREKRRESVTVKGSAPIKPSPPDTPYNDLDAEIPF